MPVFTNTLTKMCETCTLVEVISWVSTSRPIDFRDVICSLEMCISLGQNAKFVYLFNRYIKPDLPHKLVDRLQFRARISKNRILIRYMDNLVSGKSASASASAITNIL